MEHITFRKGGDRSGGKKHLIQRQLLGEGGVEGRAEACVICIDADVSVMDVLEAGVVQNGWGCVCVGGVVVMKTGLNKLQMKHSILYSCCLC